MYFNKPIFTSDLDFAIGVCQNAGIYFDPFNSGDILSKMKKIENKDFIKTQVEQGKQILSSYPKDWNETGKIIYDKLKAINKK